ncbi:MAG: addiction module toxin, HicA family [Candidatus Kapaibacterium sp.]|nr:MAG: addiction module toxin, HicA family [Candidatus Kapabacteria bacterium]
MKIKELIKLIEHDGWVHSSTKGSHRQFKHPVKSGKVTVNGKLNDDVSEFIRNSVLKVAPHSNVE